MCFFMLAHFFFREASVEFVHLKSAAQAHATYSIQRSIFFHIVATKYANKYNEQFTSIIAIFFLCGAHLFELSCF